MLDREPGPKVLAAPPWDRRSADQVYYWSLWGKLFGFDDRSSTSDRIRYILQLLPRRPGELNVVRNGAEPQEVRGPASDFATPDRSRRPSRRRVGSHNWIKGDAQVVELVRRSGPDRVGDGGDEKAVVRRAGSAGPGSARSTTTVEAVQEASPPLDATGDPAPLPCTGGDPSCSSRSKCSLLAQAAGLRHAVRQHGEKRLKRGVDGWKHHRPIAALRRRVTAPTERTPKRSRACGRTVRKDSVQPNRAAPPARVHRDQAAARYERLDWVLSAPRGSLGFRWTAVLPKSQRRSRGRSPSPAGFDVALQMARSCSTSGRCTAVGWSTAPGRCELSRLLGVEVDDGLLDAAVEPGIDVASNFDLVDQPLPSMMEASTSS